MRGRHSRLFEKWKKQGRGNAAQPVAPSGETGDQVKRRLFGASVELGGMAEQPQVFPV